MVIEQLVKLAEISTEFFGMCDMAFMPVYSNAAARQMVGLADADQVGQTPVQDFFFPEDQAFITDEFFPCVLRDGSGKTEIRFRHFVTGEPVWVVYSLVVLRDDMGRPIGLGTVTHDISERKRTEAALRESEARERAVFAASPTPLLVMAPDARRFVITRVNDAYLAATMTTRADLIGRDVFELYPEHVPHPSGYGVINLRESLERVMSTRSHDEVPDLKYDIVGPGNIVEERWWRLANSPVLNEQGEVDEIIHTASDITAHHNLHAMLAQKVTAAVAEREIALAQVHEMQKLETIGQLTGGVAHDFNNLLTPIVGALDLLQRKLAEDDRSQRLIAGAQQSAERARVLVTRLLTFARRQHLEPRSVDVNEIVRGLEDMITRTIGPQFMLQFDIATGLSPAFVDPNQLELAVINLCVNARDAMPDGGRIIVAADMAGAAEAEALRLEPGNYVRIRVIDNGAGMDPETLKRSVEPFYTTKKAGKGTGLGLSMVHGLAGQSGGILQLHSLPGAGTTATIWLPAANTRAVSRGGETASEMARTRPIKVLLVDDEELVRIGIGDMLADLGHEVVTAGSGFTALELLKRGDIDLMVTDYAMPGMTGGELASAAHGLNPDLPILLITGYANLSAEVGSGVPRLAKPFRQADLAACMASLIEGRIMAAAPAPKE